MSASGLERPPRGPKKLFDLTFAEFLKLLRERGRGAKADDLERRAIERLCPPLTEAQIMEASVEAVTIAAEIISLAPATSGSGNIQSRINELKSEGFAVVPGVKYAK